MCSLHLPVYLYFDFNKIVVHIIFQNYFNIIIIIMIIIIIIKKYFHTFDIFTS